MDAFSIGTTEVLLEDGVPQNCTCGITSMGKILYSAISDYGGPNVPVGARLCKHGTQYAWDEDVLVDESAAVDICARFSTRWIVPIPRALPGRWFHYSSPGLFSDALHWYISGDAPSEERLPEEYHAGSFLGTPSPPRSPAFPHETGPRLDSPTIVVETTFPLEREDKSGGTYYRTNYPLGPGNRRWRFRYNGMDAPPPFIPAGSLIGVFVSLGGRWDKKLPNPMTGGREKFRYLKIGSIIRLA